MSSGGIRVAVTGATGFLGGHIVKQLQEAGHEPVAVTRKQSRAEGLKKAGVEVRRVDFEDEDSVEAGLHRAKAVIHAAGGGDVSVPAELERQNAGLTEVVVGAAKRAGVRRFVLVSSLAAAGPSTDSPRRESDPEAPVSLYGKAKLQAEKVALARARELEVLVVRPPSIYGPGDTRFLPMLRAVARGLAPVPPTIAMSLVYGPDCARALVECAVGSGAGPGPKSGDVFFVAHPDPVTFREIAESMAAALGKKRIRAVSLAPWMVKLGGAVSQSWANLRGKTTPFGRDKAIDGVQRFWLCSSALAAERLGWTASTELEEGILATVEDAKERGWI